MEMKNRSHSRSTPGHEHKYSKDKSFHYDVYVLRS